MNIKRKIFEYIVDNQTRWNRVPGRSELRQIFAGLTDDVDLLLQQLEREGLLALDRDGGEEITIALTYRHVPRLKLLGRRSIDSQSLPGAGEDGSIALDLRGMGVPMDANMYALYVHDESMIDAGFQRGDVAILRHAPPQRGDIVAVEIDGQVHLRRFVLLAGIPHLLAENPFQPDVVYACDLPLQGVLWASIRTSAARLVADHAQRKMVAYSASDHREQAGKYSQRSNRRRAPANSQAKGGRAVQGKYCGHEPSTRSTASRPESQPGWPKPPSGIELNDMASIEYKGSDQASVEDEPGYGWHLQQAIKAYEEKEKKLRRERIEE